jgi:hypothetical protein
VKRTIAVTTLLALVVAGPAAAKISPSDRAAINRTLDGFVNHALTRKDVDAAWNLVTPDLRTGITRKSWDAGNVPVIPYPAAGKTHHEWTVDSATPTQVNFELIVPAAKTADSSIQFYGTMRKIGGRWLVDSFNPSATFGGGAVVGAQDFAPQQNGGPGTGVATLGSVWIVVPAALIGAGILFLLGWFLFGSLRARRRREHVRPLDPLMPRRRERSEPALVAEEGSQADG